MKKYILFFIILVQSFTNFAMADKNWAKHYKIVLDDIRVIQKSKKKDLQVWLRLLALYSEKHSLLVKRTNELKILNLSKDQSKRIKVYEKRKSTTLRSLVKIADYLKDKVKDRESLVKIHYFKSLNFYLIKRYGAFYSELKKAESFADSVEYKRKIYTKLADYLYNEKKYLDAEKYYDNLLALGKDQWVPKYLFNQAWIYFKTNRKQRAIKFAVRAFKLSKSKYYISMDDQISDTVILMYALANRVDDSFDFIEENSSQKFEDYMKLINYTFNHGNKLKVIKVFNRLDKKEWNKAQNTKILKEKISKFRSLKKFKKINLEVYKILKSKALFIEGEKELTDELLSYTSFLQTLVKSSLYEKFSKYFLRYIENNFNLLSRIDPTNKLRYTFLKGETYFGRANFKRAIAFYKAAIVSYQNGSKKDVLYQVFQSYFKSLENLPQGKYKLEDTLWCYSKFLVHFPEDKRSKTVRQKRISLLFTLKNYPEFEKAISVYNTKHPRDRVFSKNIVKQYINLNVDAFNIDKLVKIKNSNFIKTSSFSLREIAGLKLIIDQLRFKELDTKLTDSKETDKVGSINSLLSIKDLDANIKHKAIKRSLKFYSENNNINELGLLLQTYLVQPIIIDVELAKYYTFELCKNLANDECFKNLEKIKGKYPHKFDSNMKILYFKLLISYKKFDTALPLAIADSKLFPYFKQNLMISGLDVFFDTYAKLPPRFKAQLKDEVNELSHHYFLNSITSQSSLRMLDNNLTRQQSTDLFQSLAKVKNGVKFDILKISQKEINFQAFQAYLESLVKQIQTVEAKAQSMIKSEHTYLGPVIVFNAQQYFIKQMAFLKAYRAQSKDLELNKAINSEVAKLGPVFLTKINAYSKLIADFFNKNKDDLSMLGNLRFFLNSEVNPMDVNMENYLWKE